jgi:peroxiredoxin
MTTDRSQRRLRAVGALSGALLILVTCPAWAAPAAHDVMHRHGIEAIDPPTAAVEFNLPDLSGTLHTLSSYRGSWVVLTFFATWCGPCAAEMPGLQTLHEARHDRGLTVVAVDVDPENNVAAYVRAKRLTFPVLLDTQGDAARLYRASSIPVTYIISPAGALVGVTRGARDWASSDALFDALAAAPAPAPEAAAPAPSASQAVALPSHLVPPDATVEVLEPELAVGEPFHVDVHVRWSGGLRDYVLLPPMLNLPASITNSGMAADTSTEAGESVVTYRLTLTATQPGQFALDAVELRYTPAGERAPVTRRIAGPILVVGSRQLFGLQVPLLLGLVGAVCLGGAGAWGAQRLRSRRREIAAAVAAPHVALEAQLLQAKRARMEGRPADFLATLMALLPADTDDAETLGQLLEEARYGGRAPAPEMLDRLERAAERRVSGLAPDPQRRAEETLRYSASEGKEPP